MTVKSNSAGLTQKIASEPQDYGQSHGYTQVFRARPQLKENK